MAFKFIPILSRFERNLLFVFIDEPKRESYDLLDSMYYLLSLANDSIRS